MTPTPPRSTSPRPVQPHKVTGWTLAEMLVVTAIFSIATVLLIVVFEDQDSFTNRTVIESLKNGIRDALIREMTERNGNGYVLLENSQQGFTYVQGGQYPYRLTEIANAMGIDSGTSQTTFSLRVDKLVAGSYTALTTPLSTELVTLVYYPEGRNENVANTTTAPTPTPPAYSTILDRSALGNRTIFYLQKDGKPVSNRVEFAFYSGRNINSNSSADTTAVLTSSGSPVSNVKITVSPLGNITATNGSNLTTTTLQMRKNNADLGTSFSLPLDLQ